MHHASNDRHYHRDATKQRQAISSAAKIATAASRFHTNYGMGLVRKKMEALGVKFTEPDIKPWVAKAKSVHEAFGKKRGGDYPKLMQAISAAAN